MPELAANQTNTYTLTTDTAHTITTSMRTDILSTPFDLTVAINQSNQLYMSSLKNTFISLPEKKWLNGPLCTEWQMTGTLKNEQDAIHPHLTPIFYLRAYKDSSIIRVSVIIENNYTYQPNPHNFVYDISINSNIPLFSKTALNHYHHARFRKVFYLDISNATPVDVTNRIQLCHIAHDIRYLMKTRAVPAYDPALINNISESKILDLVSSFNQELMGQGLVSHYLNSASKGPLPQWAAAYLLTMHPGLKQLTLGHGELSGSWSIHFRDKQTHLPVSIIDYPYCSSSDRFSDAYNPDTQKYEHPTRCNEGYDCTNNLRLTYDSLAYLPYLLTGDYYFLEELQFRANYYLIQQNPGYRAYEKGLIKGIYSKFDQAWALRTLAFTAMITPDDHPLKLYFNDIIQNNIDYLDIQRDAYHNNALGWFVITKGDDNQLLADTDADDYYTWSSGLLVSSGFADANPFYQWKSRFVVSRMNNPNYCWTFSALPEIVVGNDYNALDTSFLTMDESWYPTLAYQYGVLTATTIQSMTCNSPEMMTLLNLFVDEMPHIEKLQPLSDDYAARMQISVASAVDAGITGSVQAWEKFINRNHQPDYSSDARPNFGMVPYSLYYADAEILHTSLNPLPFMIEGESSYSIGFSIQSPPDQPVSISFVPDNQVAIFPSCLTFTSAQFNVKQFVQIEPINDTDPENYYQGTIHVLISSDDAAYSNLTFSDILYNLYDDDVLKTLSLSHTSIDFGNFQAGNADSLTISLTNNSQTPVNIQSVTINGAAFTISHECNNQLLPDDTCQIDILYQSANVGRDEAIIYINSTTDPSMYTIPLSAESSQRILKVGPDKQYQWVRSAALAAEDNDIIEIDAGFYPKDVASWTANNLTIRGIGGRAYLNASGVNEEGKAIWVIKGNNTLVENIEFSHCKVDDGNGAGIRLEGNNLIIRNCYFHHNEMGILTSINLYDCELLIDHCEFAYQGSGNKTTGRGIDHNIYINVMKKFTIQYSYIHHATIGHNIKTRAPENHILYNRIMDESIGRSSYLIDFAQGGKSIVKGNVFHLGRCSENASMISYAGELPFHVQKDLYVVNNTFVSDYDDSAVGIYIRNQTNTLVIANNLFVGNGDLWTERENGLVQSLDNTTNVVVSDIDSMHFRNPQHFDFHLTSASAAAIDAGSLINNYQGMDLIPIDEY